MVNGLINSPRYGSFFVLVLVLLAGCAARGPAPIYDRNGNFVRTNPSVKQTPIVRPATYLVRRGDTLYGIAWRYGLDHKLIAKWNNLRQPFTIYPQQRLRLIAPLPLATEPKPSAPVTRGVPRTADTRPAQPLSAPRPAVVSKPKPAATRPVTKPPSQLKPTVRSTTKAPAGRSAPTQPSTRPPVASTNKPSRPPNQPARKPGRKPTTGGNTRLHWRWPTEGRLHRTFAAADPGRKGLDIVGTQGQAVKAAAPGEVVYSGAGLIGYGELIIIKHNQQFLSAYGHNRSRLVKEGEQVVAGQTIAEMGSSGTDRSMLHFEVRRDGQPVDPQLYLPRR